MFPMTRIFHRLFLKKWIPCQAVTSVLCLLFRPKTVHCSTKNAYTSEITFLALHPWYQKYCNHANTWSSNKHAAFINYKIKIANSWMFIRTPCKLHNHLKNILKENYLLILMGIHLVEIQVQAKIFNSGLRSFLHKLEILNFLEHVLLKNVHV